MSNPVQLRANSNTSDQESEIMKQIMAFAKYFFFYLQKLEDANILITFVPVSNYTGAP